MLKRATERTYRECQSENEVLKYQGITFHPPLLEAVKENEEKSFEWQKEMVDFHDSCTLTPDLLQSSLFASGGVHRPQCYSEAAWRAITAKDTWKKKHKEKAGEKIKTNRNKKVIKRGRRNETTKMNIEWWTKEEKPRASLSHHTCCLPCQACPSTNTSGLVHTGTQVHRWTVKACPCALRVAYWKSGGGGTEVAFPCWWKEEKACLLFFCWSFIKKFPNYKFADFFYKKNFFRMLKQGRNMDLFQGMMK